jgi:hypothetical protein
MKSSYPHGEEDLDPVENLPEGTAHVVVLREYSGPMPDDDVLEDDLVGPSEVSEFPRVRKEPKQKAEYKPGDEMPLSQAGEIWDTAQSEVLACFDEDGDRVDEPDPREAGYREAAARAIDKWGMKRFDSWTPYSYKDDADDL